MRSREVSEQSAVEPRPRLVALDLDGTVVPPMVGTVTASPTPAVRAAISRVLAADVPVVIATGRSVWNSVDTAAQLGLSGVRLVASNGAVGYDLGAQRVTHQEWFDPAPAATAMVEALPDAMFAVERGVAGFHATAGLVDGFPAHCLGVGKLAEVVATPTTRLVCWAGGHPRDAVAEAAAAVLSGLDLEWIVQRSGWVDISPPGITKATGVAVVAAELGVDAQDVVAFGDGGNDLPLFGWAGRSVAMGQAAEDIRAAATHITGTVQDDGAATALDWWFAP